MNRKVSPHHLKKQSQASKQPTTKQSPGNQQTARIQTPQASKPLAKTNQKRRLMLMAW
jgi:hypothetical protein